MNEDLIHRAAEWAGVLPAYHDLSGTEHFTPLETKLTFLSAMGLDTNEDALNALLEDIELGGQQQALPDHLIIRANHPTDLPWRGPAQAYSLVGEDGTGLHITAEEAHKLPALMMGYYALSYENQTCTLFVAPARAPSVEDITGHERVWGITSGFYGLRSSRNTGIGDFEDLACLAEIAGAHGASFLGINPVHSLGTDTGTFSPYSPSHRRLLNTRHIAIDQIAELPLCDAAQKLLSDQSDATTGIRNSTHVDHGAVADSLLPVLHELFETLETAPQAVARKKAFDDFLIDSGKTVWDHAIFEELSYHHGPDWRSWPSALQSPNSEEVQLFARESSQSIRFHCYLQWVARQQLTQAQRRGRAAGMGLGLYTDLAVGVVPGGAETWMQADVFAHGVSLGAPPDFFNASGQRWNLAPMNPLYLRQKSFAPFIETIRAALTGAGMMRIDHVLGLQRSFWMPDDSNQPGAYVSYPRDILIAIIKIEATRAGAVVVGEDLGVIPDGLRAELDASGLYGCSVMLFERNDDGSFATGSEYRERSIACIGTHDTPTISGYWNGADISARVSAGQIDENEASHRHNERIAERERFCALTNLQCDCNGPDAAIDDGMRVALHKELAKSHAALVAVQLEDILGQVEQPNMPGTTTEYPNWRIKYATPIEDLKTHQGLEEIATTMARGRLGQDPDETENTLFEDTA